MRKIILIPLALFLLFPKIGSTAEVLDTTHISTAVMGNGLKAIVMEDHSAELVAVDAWVKTGTINETDETNGISHFVEHLLFKRTIKRGLGEADRDIESIGATLDASTSRDWTHYHTVVARQYLPIALEILSDVLMHPVFDPDDIAKERRVILDEIAQRDSNYTQFTINALYAAAYDNHHPYRFAEEGTPENIKRFTRQDILNYYNTYYVPNNMDVVIVGDIALQDAVSAVGQAFQGFKKKDVPKLSEIPNPTPAGVIKKKIDAKLSATHVAIGFHAPSVENEPDVQTMDVLLTYLGLGYQSWISTELQDKQKLVSNTMADFLTQRLSGLITIYFVAKPGDVEKAEQAVLAKVRELREKTISDEDLARAKRSLEGSYAFQNETFASRANTLGFYDSIKDYKFSTEYVTKIRAVNAEDIQRVVKQYLDPGKAVIVEVGQ